MHRGLFQVAPRLRSGVHFLVIKIIAIEGFANHTSSHFLTGTSL